MTDDFNLAVYIKGDRKAVAVYNARLEIDYGPGPATYDLEVSDLTVPASVSRGEASEWSVTVYNNGPAVASGTMTIEGVTSRNWSYGPWVANFSNLAPGASRTFSSSWSTNVNQPMTIDWTATVDGTGDTNPSNDTLTATTTVN